MKKPVKKQIIDMNQFDKESNRVGTINKVDASNIPITICEIME
jgi:hypothetical protein